MRAVIDTNVVVSGLHGTGPPAQILDAWHARRFEWIISAHLLEELDEVLARPWFRTKLGWDEERRRAFLAQVSSATISVIPTARLRVIDADPDDDRVLEAAVEGAADYIVTGDRDLLDFGAYAAIRIITPREFLSRLNTPG